MRYLTKKSNVAAALLCLVGAVNAAEASLLPIKSGTYVINTYKPCEDAPFAGLMQFDGKSFFGPHDADCTSKVRRRHNKTYEIATECRARGDGTPATPTTVVDYLRIESPTHFVRLGQGSHSDYELCPAWH